MPTTQHPPLSKKERDYLKKELASSMIGRIKRILGSKKVKEDQVIFILGGMENLSLAYKLGYLDDQEYQSLSETRNQWINDLKQAVPQIVASRYGSRYKPAQDFLKEMQVNPLLEQKFVTEVMEKVNELFKLSAKN